jgi:hypothetical protein
MLVMSARLAGLMAPVAGSIWSTFEPVGLPNRSPMLAKSRPEGS